MNDYLHLLLDVDSASDVATLTLNRPDKLNALNRALLMELSSALYRIQEDEQVRSLVLTGAGTRAFAAGADIAEISELQSAADGVDFSRFGQDVFSQLENLPIPVIVAINGYALGGGCELALCGDIRLAADTAQLGQTEIALGLIPGYGGTQRLARIVGRDRAKTLVFTGERIGALDAQRLGLVDRVVPAGQLLEEATTLARSLAAKAPVALALAKRAINEGIALPLQEALELEARLFGEAVATEDRREGTAAFLERRQPRWSGR